MNNNNILIQNIAGAVQLKLRNAEGGHDWWHIDRVWKNAKLIARTEKVNMFIVELAALLHDIADAKFHDGDEELGPGIAFQIMTDHDIEEMIKNEVIKIVKNISFKNSLGQNPWTSPELRVVQDADRLDAIGAIGIARCFNYGGFKNRTLYDPEIPPNLEMTKKQYKSSQAPTINHFYEKLFKLKGLMNTQTGKQMAIERHDFMLQFIEQYYKEVGHTPVWHKL